MPLTSSKKCLSSLLWSGRRSGSVKEYRSLVTVPELSSGLDLLGCACTSTARFFLLGDTGDPDGGGVALGDALGDLYGDVLGEVCLGDSLGDPYGDIPGERVGASDGNKPCVSAAPEPLSAEVKLLSVVPKTPPLMVSRLLEVSA